MACGDQKTRTVQLELPWPPSVNHYWRHQNGRHHISAEGRSYRQIVAVTARLKAQIDAPLEGRLSAMITAWPPDRRRRDLDNVLKALLDALEHAKIYHDDSQIDHLTIERGRARLGRVLVTITELESTPCQG